jgi:hypothetical protein
MRHVEVYELLFSSERASDKLQVTLIGELTWKHAY